MTDKQNIKYLEYCFNEIERETKRAYVFDLKR